MEGAKLKLKAFYVIREKAKYKRCVVQTRHVIHVPDWEEEIGKIKNTEMDELLHIIDRVGCLYASSEYADIYFEDVPALVRYEISEYDGTEAVRFI